MQPVSVPQTTAPIMPSAPLPSTQPMPPLPAPISNVTDATPSPMEISPSPLANAWNAFPPTLPLAPFVPAAPFNPYAAQPFSMPYTTASILPSAPLPTTHPIPTFPAPNRTFVDFTDATPAPMEISPRPLASAWNAYPTLPRSAPPFATQAQPNFAPAAPFNPYAARPVAAAPGLAPMPPAPQPLEDAERYSRMVWNLLRACNQNDRRVQYLMAHYMNEGFGIPPNPLQAAKLFTKANENRSIQAPDDRTDGILKTGILNILKRYVSIIPEKGLMLAIYNTVLELVK